MRRKTDIDLIADFVYTFTSREISCDIEISQAVNSLINYN